MPERRPARVGRQLTATPLLLGANARRSLDPCEADACSVSTVKKRKQEQQSSEDHYLVDLVRPLRTYGATAVLEIHAWRPTAEVVVSPRITWTIRQPTEVEKSIRAFDVVRGICVSSSRVGGGVPSVQPTGSARRVVSRGVDGRALDEEVERLEVAPATHPATIELRSKGMEMMGETAYPSSARSEGAPLVPLGRFLGGPGPTADLVGTWTMLVRVEAIDTSMPKWATGALGSHAHEEGTKAPKKVYKIFVSDASLPAGVSVPLQVDGRHQTQVDWTPGEWYELSDVGVDLGRSAGAENLLLFRCDDASKVARVLPRYHPVVPTFAPSVRDLVSSVSSLPSGTRVRVKGVVRDVRLGKEEWWIAGRAQSRRVKTVVSHLVSESPTVSWTSLLLRIGDPDRDASEDREAAHLLVRVLSDEMSELIPLVNPSDLLPGKKEESWMRRVFQESMKTYEALDALTAGLDVLDLELERGDFESGAFRLVFLELT